MPPQGRVPPRPDRNDSTQGPVSPGPRDAVEGVPPSHPLERAPNAGRRGSPPSIGRHGRFGSDLSAVPWFWRAGFHPGLCPVAGESRRNFSAAAISNGASEVAKRLECACLLALSKNDTAPADLLPQPAPQNRPEFLATWHNSVGNPRPIPAQIATQAAVSETSGAGRHGSRTVGCVNKRCPSELYPTPLPSHDPLNPWPKFFLPARGMEGRSCFPRWHGVTARPVRGCAGTGLFSHSSSKPPDCLRCRDSERCLPSRGSAWTAAACRRSVCDQGPGGTEPSTES